MTVPVCSWGNLHHPQHEAYYRLQAYELHLLLGCLLAEMCTHPCRNDFGRRVMGQAFCSRCQGSNDVKIKTLVFKDLWFSEEHRL